MSSTIDSILVESRVFPPSRKASADAVISGMDHYRALCEEADSDFEGFWGRLAREHLQWRKPFTKILDDSQAPFYTWFDDGEPAPWQTVLWELPALPDELWAAFPLGHAPCCVVALEAALVGVPTVGTPVGQVVIGSSANPGLRDFAIAARIVDGEFAFAHYEFAFNPAAPTEFRHLPFDRGSQPEVEHCRPWLLAGTTFAVSRTLMSW